MKNIKLDKEEDALLALIENDEWESVPNLEEEIRQHRQYARNTLNRNHQVNISISYKDLEEIQVKAV